MGKTVTENKSKITTSSDEATISKNKQKNQGKKRKRHSSGSSNGDEIILPDNALETERNVHASAVKNNLDETSVRKIIKKVVTNDHVLALVKLREEEENSSTDDKELQPKLTRAKVKELKKVSPKSAAWNLENLELTPIKHIHVKTRPEVKALIAQELPEDEDDEEYEPANDEVLSEDEHGLESCSDLDSQPRTPATPANSQSPLPVKDGPFKVPQNVSTARRKLDVEEEATIALRTRSKLSLSATSIEHIESTFVPPDDLPVPDVDDLWNEFLNECLNPASTSKHEDDDETDPEYNVAADPDANDEDEEALGNTIIKISKKELNDLVTELFNIMPAADEELAENLANSVLTDNSEANNSQMTQWEAKQEPLSDDEILQPSKRLTFEKRDTYNRVSDSKSEPEDVGCETADNVEGGKEQAVQSEKKKYLQCKAVIVTEKPNIGPCLTISSKNNKVQICIEERPVDETVGAPPSLQPKIAPISNTVHIQIEGVTVTPEQRLILQQQLRQHVQLATSNFLQLFVHPIHWKLGPVYKEYLVSLMQLTEKNKNSIANVCNLKPALELVTTWEKSVSENTPENTKMIEFIQGQVERNRRRAASNCLYVGEFHDTFKKVVANSSVFLYPFLLPAMPYRPDRSRRFYYLYSEDVLIVLGIDQFRKYIEMNPQMFNFTKLTRARRSLSATLELVVRNMMPWSTAKSLSGHINAINASKDEHNPLYRYFKFNELPKIEHKLMPYNPRITLYEQPEHEMPKIWVRYLAKTSKRFKNYLYKRITTLGKPPEGVAIDTGVSPESFPKTPLPEDFTKQIVNHRSLLNLETPLKLNFQTANNNSMVTQYANRVTPVAANNVFKLVQTSTGAFLLPVNTQTVASNSGPITTPVVKPSLVINPIDNRTKIYEDHCICCELLRKINKNKQMLITDYYKGKNQGKKCDCNNMTYPKITKRLKMLVKNHKNLSELNFKDLERKLKDGYKRAEGKDADEECDAKDIAFVLSYQLKVFAKASMSRRIYVKKRVYNLLAGFKLDSSDPIKLAADLFKAYDAELVDLYLDFLGFLTPEQVDTMNTYKEYFTRNCAKDLMDRIEEQVGDKEARNKMLSQIKSIYTDSESTSCEMCTALLKTMNGYPKLAEYTFSLFPHRQERRSITLEKAYFNVTKNNPTNTTYDEPHNTVDYEADQSSCGEDSDNMVIEDIEEPATEKEQDNNIITTIKSEPVEFPLGIPETTVPKREAQEYESDTSMSIYDLDNIKDETPDWRRDEDKLILEVLQEHLTPEERRGKTIANVVELLQEKNVYGVISKSLCHRLADEIKERMLYLLTLLVLNENASNNT